jgi:hypothetical protein
MKNMVIDKVCRTPITTTLVIPLFTKRNFFLITCSMRMEKVLWSFSGEKLHQTLLKFIPLYSPSICNLIASLKHHLGNLGSIDYILKLKVFFGYNYIQHNYIQGIFLVSRLGRRFICLRCSSIELHPDLIWSNKCNQVMIYKMHGWCSIM